MLSLKKKPKVPTPGAGDLLVVSGEVPAGFARAQRAVAFGLTWKPIVRQGADAKKTATAMARKTGANHVLFSRTQYGFGHIDTHSAESADKVFPALTVVARQNAGNGVYAIRLPDPPEGDELEFWLGVTRDGKPTSIDRIIRVDNSAELVEEATKIVEDGLGDGLSYQIYSNVDGAFSAFQNRLERFGPEDILACNFADEDQLKPLSKNGTAIPKPVMVVVCVGLCLMVVQKGWSKYEEHKRARLAAMNVHVDEPPEQAWARVTSKWASEHAAGNKDGLLKARLSLGEVPILWGAWKLEAASCAAGAVGAAQPAAAGAVPAQGGQAMNRVWSCSARYNRTEIGRANREVLEHVPAGWSVRFTGLTQLDATWQFTQFVNPVDFAKLVPPSKHMVDTASELQSLSQAYSSSVGFAFTPVAFPPPKKQDGMAFPMDPSVPKVSESSVEVKAPLRTIDALLEREIPADWYRIAISINPSQLTNSSLKSSSLAAEAKGVIYAKD